MIGRNDVDSWVRWLRDFVRAEAPAADQAQRAQAAGHDHLARASDSLRALLSDRSIPASVSPSVIER